MNIDKSNYEIWLIDWLDGNLNDLQIEELRSFLDMNPELWAEFGELNKVRISPDEESFRGKEFLKRSVNDLPASQFEYLCVASLENDISSGEKAELQEIIDQNPEKKRIFESIRKTKLKPVHLRYKHRNRLIRRTEFQIFIRLSVIGLTAAAAMIFIFRIYLNVPGKLSVNHDNISQMTVPGNAIQKYSNKIIPDKVASVINHHTAEHKKESGPVAFKKENIGIDKPEFIEKITDDSPVRNYNDNETIVNKVTVFNKTDLGEQIEMYALVSSKISGNISRVDNGRTRIGRFLSKTIREKFLKDKTQQDAPLDGFEIAEAGVNGLNKLFGWEMALDKKNDATGHHKSVYFSSKILKISTPVKKGEAVE